MTKVTIGVSRVGAVLAITLVVATLVSATCVREANAHPLMQIQMGKILEIAWSPNGELLAVATDTGLRVFSQQLDLVVELHGESRIDSVTWDPSGDRFAFSTDSVIEIWSWDYSSNQADHVISLGESGNYHQIAWSPNGTWLAAFELSNPDLGVGLYNIWDMRNYQFLNQSEQYAIRFEGEHQDLFSWKPTGEPILMGIGHAVHTEGEIVTVTTDLIAYEIDIETGARIAQIFLIGPYATSIAWHPDGDFFAVGSDISLDIYSSVNGEFVHSFGFIYDALSLDWYPSGRYIAGGTGVANVTTETFLGYLWEEAGSTTTRWHPDGTLLAMGSGDGILYLGDPGELSDFEFIPIASTGPDYTLTDSDNSGSEPVTLDGSASTDPDGTIVSYVWTEDGVEIATGPTPTVELAVGIHSITLTVTDDNDLTDSDEVVITVEPGTTLAPLSSFVALGQEGVWVQQNTTVLSGNVGANTASDGPYLAQGWVMRIRPSLSKARRYARDLQQDTTHSA